MVASEKSRCIQCTIVGDKMIGKSKICKYLHQNAPEDLKSSIEDTYEPTIFDHVAGCTKIFGENVTVGVFDCSSDEDLSDIRKFAYKDSGVFIIAYSVVDRLSFENISKGRAEIENFLGRKFTFLLLGTQKDIRDSVCLDQDLPVSKEEGALMARQTGADYFMECSVLDTSSLSELFQQVAFLGRKHKRCRSAGKFVRRLFRTNI